MTDQPGIESIIRTAQALADSVGCAVYIHHEKSLGCYAIVTTDAHAARAVMKITPRSNDEIDK